jgi:integrase
MKLAMRLFQHRGIWYVETNGKRRSLKTRDKAEARRIYAQVKKEWLAGKLAYLTGQCHKTIGDYREEFLAWSEKVQPRSTFRANRLALGKLIHFTGERLMLDRITRKHLDQMIADCRAKNLSTASINIYIRHARAVLNKAVDWEYVQRNPLAGVKQVPVERAIPVYLRKDEAARFMAGIADVDLRRLVTAYLVTGRRRRELLELRWEDIDWDRGSYLVRHPKRGQARWYPVNAMFRAVLAAIGVKDAGPVFTRWRYPDTISKLVKTELTKAGLGHMHLHHLRHTYASLKIMDGTPLKVLQELLGHSEYRTTEIYAHIADDHLAEAAEINLGPVDLG